MNADENGITFSTGKTLYANRGIVGICMIGDSEDRDLLFYGYDGGLNLPKDVWCDSDRRLTPAECVELADAMLTRWAEFRAQYARA